METIGNITKEQIEPTSKALEAKGYISMTSGLQAGEYSGTVDNIEEFISVATYDKPNGNNKGGVMYAVRGTIQINGGQAFKVDGFDVVGAKRLLMAKDQVKLLSPNCSFTFTVTDKGYSSKVAVSKETEEDVQLSAAIIQGMTKPKLTKAATENGVDITGLNIDDARAKLIKELELS